MWREKKARKEVHPLVSFATNVQVREFTEEQHPTLFHKIHPPPESPPPPPPFLPQSLASIGSCLNEEWKHHSILIGSESGESSATGPEESWTDAEETNVEKRLTISEGDSSKGEHSCRESVTVQDINFEDKDVEIGDEQSIYKDGSCKLKDEEQAHSSKAESLKIKWSYKRKRKKRLRLKIPPRPRKVLLLGDMNCGKSSLVTTYCRDRFQETYSPTILHCCHSDAKVMGRRFELILADTPGREDYKLLRKCVYLMTDVAILCYSAADRKTLDKIRRYWLPELNEHAPNCPFVIAETKKDVREEYEDRKLLLEENGKTGTTEYRQLCREMEGIVPEGMGAQLARELGAQGFYSTSAKYRVGTRVLFQEATAVAVKKSRRKRKIRE